MNIKISDILEKNTHLYPEEINEDKTADALKALADETFQDPGDFFKLAEIIKGLASVAKKDERAMKALQSIASAAKAAGGMSESSHDDEGSYLSEMRGGSLIDSAIDMKVAGKMISKISKKDKAVGRMVQQVAMKLFKKFKPSSQEKTAISKLQQVVKDGDRLDVDFIKRQMESALSMLD